MRNTLVGVCGILVAGALLLPGVGLGANTAAACGEVHPKTGDLNADGRVNSLDALAILVYQAGMAAAEPDSLWMGGADVDCDGSVNAIDATIILQVDAGLTTIRP
jgi:hypothetical protein